MTRQDTSYGHRNTEGLSDLGKRIIASCPRAFVNDYGQVIDPCHVWFSEANDPTAFFVRLWGETI